VSPAGRDTDSVTTGSRRLDTWCRPQAILRCPRWRRCVLVGLTAPLRSSGRSSNASTWSPCSGSNLSPRGNGSTPTRPRFVPSGLLPRCGSAPVVGSRHRSTRLTARSAGIRRAGRSAPPGRPHRSESAGQHVGRSHPPSRAAMVADRGCSRCARLREGSSRGLVGITGWRLAALDPFAAWLAAATYSHPSAGRADNDTLEGG
jgi:hypothetical protein